MKTNIFVLIAMFTVTLGSIEAHADIGKRCKNAVCGRSTYDGTRVNIYLASEMSGTTHFNFKTNPGAQIELRDGHYSFAQRRGRTGTYSVQACKRGGFAQSSFCTQWATFEWDSLRD
jgi:hypothetical protein